MATTPGRERRAQALDRLSTTHFDLLVIGGGITGAGIALDAATRGLSVALVDKADFASGTSSKSSKLIHGGLRYLEQREFGLVHESVSERDLLRRMAPHLVTPVGFFWPRWAGAKRKVGAGLWIYDLLAGFNNIRRHTHLDADEAAKLVPGTNRRSGGYLFYDAQADDVRLTLAVVQAARRFGAVVCNHLEVEEFVEIGGRLIGCAVRDAIEGHLFEVRARDLVNATGVWADDLRAKEARECSALLRPSKGIHIVISRKTLPLAAACLLPTSDRRLIFAVPWRSSVLVGTTDSDYGGPLDRPSVSAEEVSLMLEALSLAFDRAFIAADVTGAFAGLRPLLADSGHEKTRDLSRKHAMLRGPRGLVTITGGKMTTFRRMAKDVVDLITRRRGSHVGCVTGSIRLGDDWETSRAAVSVRGGELGLPPEVTDSLLSSYGSAARRLLELGDEMELLTPVADGLPYLAAEVVWGIRNEMATTAGDVLARRMRLGLEHRTGGTSRRSLLIELLSRELEISEDEAEEQIHRYEEGLTFERGPALPLETPRRA